MASFCGPEPEPEPMAELHHQATWDARIAEAERVSPRCAAWIAEALELGDRALRASSAATMDSSQRLAEQRDRSRTSEDLLESLAKRLLAAAGALDEEKQRHDEADRHHPAKAVL